MITRKNFTAGLAATVAGSAGAHIGGTAVADQNTIRYAVPSGACDCHVHVFEPKQFPFAANRSYTPGTASLEDLESFERQTGMQRLVVVQPSVYGSDNACLVDALKRLGDKARGVAVIDADKVTDSELDALNAAGVRSVRVNLEAKGHRDPAEAGKALSVVARRIAGRGWSIQVYAALPVLAAVEATAVDLPIPLVVDHFGGARAAEGRNQQGFASLIAMLKTGKVYAKLSAPYRASDRSPDYIDMEEIVREMVAAAPNQLVWASDWPHTGGGATGSNDRKGRSLSDIEPFRSIDVKAILARMSEWCDETTWKKIVSENAARLYFS